MIPFLNVLQYLVLTLWVGAMFGFGTLYAPVLYRSLSSREEADAIAEVTLSRIDTLGLVTGGIMLVITVLQAIDSRWQAVDLGRILTAIAMVGVVGTNVVTIRQRLNDLRQRLVGSADDAAEDDPLRLEYTKHYRISRGLFTLALVLGVLLIVLSAVAPTLRS